MLPYLETYDAVVGNRTNRVLKFRRKVQTSFYNWLIRILFNLSNRDVNCEIRLFKISEIKKININKLAPVLFSLLNFNFY